MPEPAINKLSANHSKNKVVTGEISFCQKKSADEYLKRNSSREGKNKKNEESGKNVTNGINIHELNGHFC